MAKIHSVLKVDCSRLDSKTTLHVLESALNPSVESVELSITHATFSEEEARQLITLLDAIQNPNRITLQLSDINVPNIETKVILDKACQRFLQATPLDVRTATTSSSLSEEESIDIEWEQDSNSSKEDSTLISFDEDETMTQAFSNSGTPVPNDDTPPKSPAADLIKRLEDENNVIIDDSDAYKDPSPITPNLVKQLQDDDVVIDDSEANDLQFSYLADIENKTSRSLILRQHVFAENEIRRLADILARTNHLHYVDFTDSSFVEPDQYDQLVSHLDDFYQLFLALKEKHTQLKQLNLTGSFSSALTCLHSLQQMLDEERHRLIPEAYRSADIETLESELDLKKEDVAFLTSAEIAIDNANSIFLQLARFLKTHTDKLILDETMKAFLADLLFKYQSTTNTLPSDKGYSHPMTDPTQPMEIQDLTVKTVQNLNHTLQTETGITDFVFKNLDINKKSTHRLLTLFSNKPHVKSITLDKNTYENDEDKENLLKELNARNITVKYISRKDSLPTAEELLQGYLSDIEEEPTFSSSNTNPQNVLATPLEYIEQGCKTYLKSLGEKILAACKKTTFYFDQPIPTLAHEITKKEPSVFKQVKNPIHSAAKQYLLVKKLYELALSKLPEEEKQKQVDDFLRQNKTQLLTNMDLKDKLDSQFLNQVGLGSLKTRKRLGYFSNSVAKSVAFRAKKHGKKKYP